jgi:hypothetical protein
MTIKQIEIGTIHTLSGNNYIFVYQGREIILVDNLEDVKRVRGRGIHNIFCVIENL